MNAKRKILATGAALSLLVAGAMTASAANAAQSGECVPDPGQQYIPPTYATEYEFTRDVYETEYEYVKEVKGKIQKKVIGWWDVDTFGWEPWSGGSTKWSETNTDVLESGSHNAVQSEWTEGSGWNKTHWRKVTTEFRYVPTGETRPGELIDTEFTWSEETSLDGWTATGKERSGEGLTRVIDTGQPYLPPVTCEDEPTTYEPVCTSVIDAVEFKGEAFDGDVLTLDVPGGWAEETFSLGWSGTLAGVGTALDIVADPIRYVGLHIITPKGNIVFEEEPTYGGNLWSKTSWDGVDPGMGYAAFGAIEEFIELNGDVPVTDIVVLYTHPEASSTAVSSATIGCTVFTWADVVPEDREDQEPPAKPVVPAKSAAPVVVQPSFTG